MRYTQRIRNIYWIGFLLIIGSCTTTEKNTIHKVYRVEIKEMRFQPAELKVQKGDTVIFINQDLVVHNITEASNKEWASSPLPTGNSWRMIATKNTDYYCSIHVVM